ncbi:uncharacterized protein [Amphiura filiformis]|uniref:uncharacterized protein isoform X2 n=1 Tax=Amphiura filiformis TaxID=82378 RepID=UPI003B20EDEC
MASPTDINTALAETFSSDADAEALMRILYFLARSQVEGVAEPYLNSLQSVINNPTVFRMVAERMIQDTRTADNDPRYRQVMHDVWSNFLRDNLSEHPNSGQEWSLAVPQNSLSASVHYAFFRSVAQLPPERFLALQQAIKAIGSAGAVAVYANRALTFARSAQPLVEVALVTAYLAYDIIKNIRRWWNNEITGTRCVKNIIDNGVSVAAGISCGIGGEMIGAAVGGGIAGPVGAAVGAIAGAVAGAMGASIAVHALSDKLTQWIFGLPQSEALEASYNFLNVSPTASNSDINSRYRHLSRTYHPDRGGDPGRWTQLQYSLAVIREARGER